MGKELCKSIGHNWQETSNFFICKECGFRLKKQEVEKYGKTKRRKFKEV